MTDDYKPPFFDFRSSSGARVFGTDVFGGKDGWLKDWIIRPTYRIGNRIHHWLWELRYRNPFGRHQYHMVNTHLEPGYYDCDTLMLHACFSLLRRYVEDECGGPQKMLEWSRELEDPDNRDRTEHGMGAALDHQAHGQNEAVALYHWWMVERPAREDRERQLTDEIYGSKRMRFIPVEGNSKLTQLSSEVVGPLTPEQVEAKQQELFRMMENGPEEDNAMLKRLIDIRGGLWT